MYARWARLMGEGPLADRPALQGRPRPRRQRRGHLQAHVGVDRRADDGGGAGGAGEGQRSRPARSTRRSRPWKTRTSARPACWPTPTIPGCGGRSRWRPRPSISPRPPAASATAPRSWASTPTRSSAGWATTARPSPACACARSSDPKDRSAASRPLTLPRRSRRRCGRTPRRTSGPYRPGSCSGRARRPSRRRRRGRESAPARGDHLRMLVDPQAAEGEGDAAGDGLGDEGRRVERQRPVRFRRVEALVASPSRRSGSNAPVRRGVVLLERLPAPAPGPTLSWATSSSSVSAASGWPFW